MGKAGKLLKVTVQKVQSSNSQLQIINIHGKWQTNPWQLMINNPLMTTQSEQLNFLASYYDLCLNYLYNIHV